MPVAYVIDLATLQTSREATNLILNQCSLEAYPFVKLVSTFSFQKAYSISGEVGVSLILHICPWRSARLHGCGRNARSVTK